MPSFVAAITPPGGNQEQFSFDSKKNRDHFVVDVLALRAKYELMAEKLIKIATRAQADPS